LNKPPLAVIETELGRHRRRVLILSSLGMFMGTLLATIVAVALPRDIGPELALTYSEALWVQAIYPLAMSVSLVPVGRIADRYGLMRLFLVGVAIFAAFSIACALAFAGPFLVVVRFLQGIGGGFMSATSAALVANVFPPQERGRGLGLNTMAGYLGLMVGPPLGGLIVSHASWRWVFAINLPLALGIIIGGRSLLGPERRDQAVLRDRASRGSHAPAGQAARLDWFGTALLGAALTCLLVPLISVPFWGWLSPLTLGLLGGSVLLLRGFVLVEDRVSDPLLDLDLVRKNRVFAAGTTAALFNYAAVYGVTIFTSVFLQIVEGLSQQRAGLYLLMSPLFMAGLSAPFGRLSDRIGQRIPATGGMLLIAGGTAQLGLLPSPAPTWRVLLALATVGIGMAAFSSPNMSSVMGSVKQSQLSLASGFLGTMRTAGQGVSVGLLGAIAASSLGPAGGRVLFLGEKASEAAAESFSGGYRTAMLVAAGLAVAGALVSMVRGPRPQ
jgi:MFS family permease